MKTQQFASTVVWLLVLSIFAPVLAADGDKEIDTPAGTILVEYSVDCDPLPGEGIRVTIGTDPPACFAGIGLVDNDADDAPEGIWADPADGTHDPADEVMFPQDPANVRLTVSQSCGGILIVQIELLGGDITPPEPGVPGCIKIEVDVDGDGINEETREQALVPPPVDVTLRVDFTTGSFQPDVPPGVDPSLSPAVTNGDCSGTNNNVGQVAITSVPTSSVIDAPGPDETFSCIRLTVSDEGSPVVRLAAGVPGGASVTIEFFDGAAFQPDPEGLDDTIINNGNCIGGSPAGSITIPGAIGNPVPPSPPFTCVRVSVDDDTATEPNPKLRVAAGVIAAPIPVSLSVEFTDGTFEPIVPPVVEPAASPAVTNGDCEKTGGTTNVGSVVISSVGANPINPAMPGTFSCIRITVTEGTTPVAVIAMGAPTQAVDASVKIEFLEDAEFTLAPDDGPPVTNGDCSGSVVHTITIGGSAPTPTPPAVGFTCVRVTIDDDGTAPAVAVVSAGIVAVPGLSSASSVSVSTVQSLGIETGSVPVTFLFTRGAPTTDAIVVEYEQQSCFLQDPSGTSCVTSDKQVQFAAGQPSVLVTVAVPDDSIAEGPETVTITVKPSTPPSPEDCAALGFPAAIDCLIALGESCADDPESRDCSGWASEAILVPYIPSGNAASAQIVDNDVLRVTGGPVIILENDNVGAPITISRGGPLINTPENGLLTVNFDTILGEADRGSDFIIRTVGGGTLLDDFVEFAPNQSQIVLQIVGVPDNADEQLEDVRFTLAPGSGYGLRATPAGTSILIQDEDIPSVSVDFNAADPNAIGSEYEPTTGLPTPVGFTVHRDTTDLAGALTVNLEFPATGGSATPGVDFTPISAAVIPAGQTMVTVGVMPISDSVDDASETILVSIATSSLYSIGTQNTALGIIKDDPRSLVSFNVVPTTMPEGAEHEVQFIRTGNELVTVEVLIEIDEGTDGKDVGGPDALRSITFTGVGTTASLLITVLDDGIVENDETLTLKIRSGPSHIVGGTGLATTKLVDAQPNDVSIIATDATANEFRATTGPSDDGSFVISRVGNLASLITVNFQVDLTLVSINDFDLTTTSTVTLSDAGLGSVTIPAETASITVNVIPTLLGGTEATEMVKVTLLAGTGYTPSSTSATVNILDQASGALASVTPGSGPATGGNSVEIKGSGLRAGTEVFFGTVKSTSVTITPDGTSMIALVPAGSAGAVEITATVPGVGTLALAGAADYTYILAPTITTVAPGSGSEHGGTTITITGTNFVAGAQVLVGGVSASSVTGSGSSLTAVTPAHAPGVVSVEVINPNGFSAVLNNAFTYVADGSPAPTTTTTTTTSSAPTGGGAPPPPPAPVAPPTVPPVTPSEVPPVTTEPTPDPVVPVEPPAEPSATPVELPSKVKEGDAIEFGFALPADTQSAKVVVKDENGNVIAEYVLTKDPVSGLWVGEGIAPEKGSYKMQLAYSTSTFALLTQDAGEIRAESTSVAGAVTENPAAVAAGTAAAGILSGAAVFVIRRRIF